MPNVNQQSVLEWYVAGEFLGYVEQQANPHVQFNLSWVYVCPFCALPWAKACRLWPDNTYAPFQILRMCCPEVECLSRESVYWPAGVLSSGALGLEHLPPSVVQWEFAAWLREVDRRFMMETSKEDPDG